MTTFTDPAEAGKLICGPAWLSARAPVAGRCSCPECTPDDDAYGPGEIR